MSVINYTKKNTISTTESINIDIDVITRSPYFITLVGYQSGLVNQGYYNCAFGYTAASKNLHGTTNMYFGTYSAENATNGSLNVFYGNFSGRYLKSGSCNTFIGNYAGQYNNGFDNILIGQNNNATSNTASTQSIIAIGNDLVSRGTLNMILGYNNTTDGTYGISIGNNLVQNTRNSLIMGQNIINTGSNSIILKNNQFASNATFSNFHNDYVNINDILFTSFESNSSLFT